MSLRDDIMALDIDLPAREDLPEDLQKYLNVCDEKLGMVPNLLRTMGNSPAVLESYLSFSGALAGASLSAADRERIALAVGEANGCEYCLAAHTAIGKSVGLDDESVVESRQGRSDDPRTAAILALSNELVEKRGWASDAALERVREVGLGDAEIAEVVATVALNTFTNYFNHVAGTEVDFPKATPLTATS